VVEAPPDWKMLEAPFGSGLDESLRAVDASGRRLEEDGSQRMTESLDPEAEGDPGERTTHVFKGKVAQARLDVADEWAEVDLSYDLAPSPRLPAGDAGTKPAGGDQGGPTVRPTAVKRLAKGRPAAR
jgi:hypothetical protein